MNYEFGVGSTKYELIAKNDDIAFFTMVMFFENPILPIAVYKPYTKTIFGKDVIDMDDIDSFLIKNSDDLRNANGSIKKIV